MPRQLTPHWCFLRDNPRLRGIVLHVKESRGLTLRQIARETDIADDRISKWLRNIKPNLNQRQLVKICELLGIEVELKVTVREYNS